VTIVQLIVAEKPSLARVLSVRLSGELRAASELRHARAPHFQMSIPSKRLQRCR
jgi:hypothetical protein